MGTHGTAFFPKRTSGASGIFGVCLRLACLVRCALFLDCVYFPGCDTKKAIGMFVFLFFYTFFYLERVRQFRVDLAPRNLEVVQKLHRNCQHRGRHVDQHRCRYTPLGATRNVPEAWNCLDQNRQSRYLSSF